ncbi:DUF2141 domain-containing protein [Flavobacterium caeni]|uniref:Uncharacterized conserved protein, DUF2141 family n=1 Tax=Flavobacterium caeni TaxID=490189 RepID=A0A1G5AUB3_9FLAO|nr:DUF2141 domain-containing protein [Flavobacterium caeni]SCX81463.1 Uncharacterized conserved protein, DUF2141 family [Flavobacterium caeni]
MKKAILVLVFLIGGWMQAQTISLEVKMTGFRTDAGNVKVGLYNNEDDFLRKVFKNAVVDIKNGTASVTFKDLPKGTYAVSVYHDENNNGKMDKNTFHIPTEGYGTSNDAKGFMGPPKYEDAKFAVAKNAKVNIKLNY